MPLVEQLGSFYLGKEYDSEARQAGDGPSPDRPVNYDSRSLVTHAICVGMTGSGKTGLCIDLLEEAALDGVPAIIIDPKGDITNLLLTFPDLRPEDFLPWINQDDAGREQLTPEQYAARVAQTWRDGLAAWDEGPERIRLLKEAADFAIYTPGSEAGLPVSILDSFGAPDLDWDTEAETLRDRIQGTISALLALVGIEADPVRSREHILLSTIMEKAWRAGKDLDLAQLILAVQKPPFQKLGVFEVDTFFPAKERFNLAVALNNIIASPSFAAWLTGAPLDIGQLLHTADGKPRHSIFYIAHLNDAERMFFVTILLEQIIGWMRMQPGTTSLRALVYMDEVFGFFPPVGEPPSKRPLLTLFKQARAFGLGMVLTTQNPVDIDYKALTNAGTWFIGKLQTERDKARLMDGLERALGDSGTLGDPQVLARLISALDSRIFLMHDVNRPAPVVFQTRWAMSYLRGPLTRQQIKALMAPRKAADAQALALPAGIPSGLAGRSPAAPAGRALVLPVQLPDGSASPVTKVDGAAHAVQAEGDHQTGAESGVQQGAGSDAGDRSLRPVYLPATLSAEQAIQSIAAWPAAPASVPSARLVYEPVLLGVATVRFAAPNAGLDESQDIALVRRSPVIAPGPSWENAVPVSLQPAGPSREPLSGALYAGNLQALDHGALAQAAHALVDHLHDSHVYLLAYNPVLKLYARVGESLRDFRLRCQQSAREGRDADVDRLRDKYAALLRDLEERMRRAQQQEADGAPAAGPSHAEALPDLGALAASLGLAGRRARGPAGAHVVGSAARPPAEEVARLQARAASLGEQMQAEAAQLTRQWAAAAGNVEQLHVPARKSDIVVHLVSPAWSPAWQLTYQDVDGHTRQVTAPAYPGPAAVQPGA